MRFLCATLLLAIVTTSCSSPASSPSPGLAAVAAVYKGEISLSEGVVASSYADQLSGRFFEISLVAGADDLRPEFGDLREPALNAAYLFYHTLTPEQCESYAFGRVVLEGKQDSSRYEFSVADLRYAEQGMVQVQQLMAYAVQQDYATLLRKGNTLAASRAEWEKQGAAFLKADREYGRVKDFTSRGMTLFTQATSAGPLRLLSATLRLKRGQDTLPFIMLVDPAGASEQPFLYGLEFFGKKTK